MPRKGRRSEVAKADLGDQVVEAHERLREVARNIDVKHMDSAAVVAHLMLLPIHESDIRRVFPHGLSGVDDDTIHFVRSLVRTTLHAVIENDVAQLKAIAQKTAELFDMASPVARVATALATIERVFLEVSAGEQPKWNGVAYEIWTRLPEIENIETDDLGAFIAQAVSGTARQWAARTSSNIGRGARGPRAILAQLMADAGIWTYDEADRLVAEAAKRLKKNKMRVATTT